MHMTKLVSLAALAALVAGCSRATDHSTATVEDAECPATATANGGYQASCRHNLVYNGQPKGMVTYEHKLDPSRGCNLHDGNAHVEGDATAEAGEVRATLDDVSEKISYEVDSANITVLLSDEKDWLWVRTSVPGMVAETEQKVYCPGLEQAARTRATQMGLATSKDCPADDPHHIDLGTFLCPALEAEIKSRPAHQMMIAPNRIHKMAAGMVLVGQAERLAMTGNPNRAAALPVLGVIFSALGTVFGSDQFQKAFSPKTNTDSVKGPVMVQ